MPLHQLQKLVKLIGVFIACKIFVRIGKTAHVQRLLGEKCDVEIMRVSSYLGHARFVLKKLRKIS